MIDDSILPHLSDRRNQPAAIKRRAPAKDPQVRALKFSLVSILAPRDDHARGLSTVVRSLPTNSCTGVALSEQRHSLSILHSGKQFH